jgi:hypothetical protein
MDIEPYHLGATLMPPSLKPASSRECLTGTCDQGGRANLTPGDSLSVRHGHRLIQHCLLEVEYGNLDDGRHRCAQCSSRSVCSCRDLEKVVRRNASEPGRKDTYVRADYAGTRKYLYKPAPVHGGIGPSTQTAGGRTADGVGGSQTMIRSPAKSYGH